MYAYIGVGARRVKSMHLPGKRGRMLKAFANNALFRIATTFALLTNCFTLVCFTFVLPAYALDPQKVISQFSHTAWSAKDGIAGPVWAMAQTPDGYLWLATDAGLYRFDGSHFTVWEGNGSEKLPTLPIRSLLSARDGSLWIGSSGWISHLDHGVLKNYGRAEGFQSGGIFSIVEDSQGFIWAGGPYSFGRFDGHTWHAIGSELGYKAPGIQTLFVDSHGTLWVATDGLNFGLSKDKVRVNTILKLASGAASFEGTGESAGQIWTMAEAPDGHVWVADTSGDSVWPIISNHTRHEINSGGPGTLLFDAGGLWIGSGDGIQRRSDYRLLRILPGDTIHATNGLSSDSIYSTLKDREGNLWFGTATGVDRFRENKATSYSATEGLTDGTKAITSSGGELWFAEYSGDVIQRFKDGHFQASKLPSKLGASLGGILSLNAGPDGDVWLGGEFQLIHEDHGQFSNVAVPGLEDRAAVHAIATDATGNLWITVYGGDKGSGVLRRMNGRWTDFRKTVTLPPYRCRVLHGDSSGRMWLGCDSGNVAVFDHDSFHVYSSRDGLPAGNVLAITSDNQGRIWVGGQGGLSQFENGHFATISKDNGLPGNSVSAILEDEDGFFWLAGALGVLRVSAQELNAAMHDATYQLKGMRFDALDGLRGLPRQSAPLPTAARGSDGRLWFVTTGGVAVIDPHHLPKNLIPPTVEIQGAEADGASLAPESSLRLPARTRSLRLGFAALSLTEPERIQFRYKLDGFDREWHGPTSDRQATYTNLPPREYHFRVIASNNDGVWNETGTLLDFSIAPAYYQTTWFRLACLACFALLLWALHQLRLRQQAREFNMRLEERIGERTRIARDLHDTLLQGFHGLLLRFQTVYALLPGRPEEAKQSLASAIDQAAETITEGRDAVQDLRSSAVESNDLAVAIRAVGEELSADGTNQIAPVFQVEVEGTPRSLHPILRDEVYRIAAEALRNAFRHARARQIEVEIRYDDRQLRLSVRDDGKGIDAKVLGGDGHARHYGLPGMRERAKLIGGEMTVWSQLNSGTEVELGIPASVAYATSPRRSWLLEKLSRKEPDGKESNAKGSAVRETKTKL